MPEDEPLEIDGDDSLDLAADSEDAAPSKIKFMGAEERTKRVHEREPNTTGQGAVHVRTFVSKLRTDAINGLDVQINEWLDANPQFEVKFASVTVGELTGKTKEPAMFLSVWV